MCERCEAPSNPPESRFCDGCRREHGARLLGHFEAIASDHRARIAGPHEMEYLAGLGGLRLPDRSPGWSCVCGLWSYAALPMPRRRSGNNLIEAERSFAGHLQGVGSWTNPGPDG